jgi:hypothetical protein
MAGTPICNPYTEATMAGTDKEASDKVAPTDKTTEKTQGTKFAPMKNAKKKVALKNAKKKKKKKQGKIFNSDERRWMKPSRR